MITVIVIPVANALRKPIYPPPIFFRTELMPRKTAMKLIIIDTKSIGIAVSKPIELILGMTMNNGSAIRIPPIIPYLNIICLILMRFVRHA